MARTLNCTYVVQTVNGIVCSGTFYISARSKKQQNEGMTAKLNELKREYPKTYQGGRKVTVVCHNGFISGTREMAYNSLDKDAPLEI